MFDREPSERKNDLPDRTFEFSRTVVKICMELDEKRGSAWTLSKQLIRSGTSIGANVEEAQVCHSRADFIAKMIIACREARETQYWLRLIDASDILPSGRLTGGIDEVTQLVAILTTIVKKSRGNA